MWRAVLVGAPLGAPNPVGTVDPPCPPFEYAVDIAAPPERVWQATIDIERWTDFVPTDGPLALGTTAHVTPKGFLGSTWTVTEFDSSRVFTWPTNPTGISMTARHIIEPAPGGSKMTLQLEWSGWLAGLLSPLIAPRLRSNVRREGDAFKSRCEAAP